ncbi:Protein of unknown function [Bacillus thuringiensis]|nr:Protein of unknown function [Bacillus thuringiensis]
MAIGED